MNLFHVRDGKIVEQWETQDILGLLEQLGALPAPGGGWPPSCLSSARCASSRCDSP